MANGELRIVVDREDDDEGGALNELDEGGMTLTELEEGGGVILTELEDDDEGGRLLAELEEAGGGVILVKLEEEEQPFLELQDGPEDAELLILGFPDNLLLLACPKKDEVNPTPISTAIPRVANSVL